MIYSNTDASATAISAETHALRMCIQDYLLMATVPNMHKLADYRDQIDGITDDASRMALQNWFFSHPDVQDLDTSCCVVRL